MPTEKMNILVTFKNAAKAGVQGLNRDLDKVSTSTKKASAGMKGMYAQLAAIGTLLAGGALFGGAVKTFANFDDQMRAAGAVTGAMTSSVGELSDEMQAMTAVAKKMGRETRYTSSQSAEALRFMGMAGLEATEAVKALPGVLQLAAAGALDLGTAADITTNILSSFGIEVERLADVNDVLVKTFTSSNVNLVEIGEAFKLVGPIAKGVGEDFEDLVGSIGALGNAGLKGTIAGTALKGAISALLAPTAQERDLMNSLKERLGGVSLQIKDTSGDFIGFRKIIEQLEVAGIRGEEALKIFGLRAGPAMAALINQGSDSLVTLVDKLKNAGYTAEQIAEVMEAGLGGTLRRTVSAFEAFKIAIGEAFGPEVIKFLDNFILKLAQLEVAIIEMRQDGDFEGWGEAIIKILDAIAFAAGKVVDEINLIGSVWGIYTAIFSGDLEKIGKAADNYSDKLRKLFGIIRDEDKKTILTFGFTQKNALERIKIFEEAQRKFKAIGKAEGDGERDEIISISSVETNLKAALIKIRAAGAATTALLDKNYAENEISLEKYYAERLAIINKASATERAILERKLYVESDVDKKAILNAQLFALDKALVANTINLEAEKNRDLTKLADDKIKKEKEINKFRLKAERAYQDQKARLVITDDALAGQFLKETADLQKRQNTELDLIKDYHQAIIDNLIESKATELEIEKEHIKQVKAIKDQEVLQSQEQNKLATDQDIRLNKYKLDNFITIAGGTAKALTQLYELGGRKSKELFYLSKAASLAEASMKVAQGVAGALGSPPYGPGAIANAAVIGVLGAAQIATIASTGLAEGGEVPGSSPHAKADNIPAMLTAKEFVQPVASVQHYGKDIMEGLRKRSIPKEIFSGYAYGGYVKTGRSHFAEGGLVGVNSQGVSAGQKGVSPEINIINITDPRELDKYMSTSAGQDAILNVLGARSEAANRMLRSGV